MIAKFRSFLRLKIFSTAGHLLAMAVWSLVSLLALVNHPALSGAYSIKQKVLLVLLALAVVGFLGAALWFWRAPALASRLENKVQAHPELRQMAFILSLLVAGWAWVVFAWQLPLVFGIHVQLEGFQALFLWLVLAGLQAAWWVWSLSAADRQTWARSSEAYGQGALVLLALAALAVKYTGPLGLALRFDELRLIPLLLTILLQVLSLRGRVGRALQVGVVLLLFLLPLLASWNQVVGDHFFILGIFPRSDAEGYYGGARNLLAGGLFTDMAARRPLFSALLASLMALAGGDLRPALFVIVAAAGLASYFLAYEVQRTHGTLAAALTLLLQFYFYRSFAGSTMTENLGLTLGALGLALLWPRGSRRAGLRLFTGLFFLTLGLLARAGPMFLLAGFIIWAAGWLDSGWKLNLRRGGLALGAVVLGFALNQLVYAVTSPPTTAVNASLAWALYGQAKGGIGWKAIFIEHPELARIDEAQASKIVYRMAWDAFRDNPFNLVKAVFKSWQQFLFHPNYSVYAFVIQQKGAGEQISVLLLLALGALGLGRELWLRSPLGRMLAAAGLGIWLSIPAAPPADAAVRLYATVIPYFAVLAGLGAASLLRWGQARPQPAPEPSAPTFSEASLWASLGLGLLFVGLLTFGPWLIRQTARPVDFNLSAQCPAGQQSVVVNLGLSNRLSIYPDAALSGSWIPNVRWSDYQSGVYRANNLDDFEGYLSIQPNRLLIRSADLISGQGIWLVAPLDQLPQTSKIIQACGQKQAGRLGFFIADSVYDARAKE